MTLTTAKRVTLSLFHNSRILVDRDSVLIDCSVLAGMCSLIPMEYPCGASADGRRMVAKSVRLQQAISIESGGISRCQLAQFLRDYVPRGTTHLHTVTLIRHPESSYWHVVIRAVKLPPLA